MICSVHSHKSYIPENAVSLYPSIIHMDILAERCDDATARHALASTVAALKTNGSMGIYAQMHVGDGNTVERYARLNMFELARTHEQPDDLVLVARTI